MSKLQKDVLIIDDDSRNIFALKATLVSYSYTCYTALTAQEGIDILLKCRYKDCTHGHDDA